MTMVFGKQAPDFTSPAVLDNNVMDDNFNFKKYMEGSITVLFFWPFDFSYVCPSEVIAFSNRCRKFQEKGVKVVGCSVDSHYTHYTWKNTPVEQGGIGEIKFPLVSDIGGEIAKSYGILSEKGVAYRATFVIDQKGKVVHMSINDMKMGRNVDETLRIIDALTYIQQKGKDCPANWRKGDEGIKETKEDTARFLKEKAETL